MMQSKHHVATVTFPTLYLRLAQQCSDEWTYLRQVWINRYKKAKNPSSRLSTWLVSAIDAFMGAHVGTLKRSGRKSGEKPWRTADFAAEVSLNEPAACELCGKSFRSAYVWLIKTCSQARDHPVLTPPVRHILKSPSKVGKRNLIFRLHRSCVNTYRYRNLALNTWLMQCKYQVALPWPCWLFTDYNT